MAGLVLVTAPADEPLTLPDAKKHLKVSFDDEDELIERLRIASRQAVERRLGRALITQIYDYTLDGFPAEREIELPRPPLRSVASVKYTPDGGSETMFDAANYLVDTTGNPGRVVLGRNKNWPTDDLRAINGVVIRFTAGYGDTEADVPEPIRQAILIHLGTLYEHREAVITGTIVSTIPTVDRLLDPYVWRRVA